MEKMKLALRGKDSVVSEKVSRLFVAFELSQATWRLAISVGGTKVRHYKVSGGDKAQTLAALEKAKEQFGLKGRAVRVVSCYEAGRDGFWLHRFLEESGIQNVVVDSASIEVKRQARRAKTDRLDAEKLLTMLVRYHGGEAQVWRVLRIPNEQDEDARRPHRELERLKKEQTGHTNRIGSLLILHNIREANIGGRNWQKKLEQLKERLPAKLAEEVKRESERLELVREQIRQIEKAQEAQLEESSAANRFSLLRGIGVGSGATLQYEFFGWRDFNNRREVGSCAGLTGSPYQSGQSNQEQGISKAGNKRIRWLIIELAWSWLRYQPESALSQWFNQRFAKGGARARRIGIVALARRLLVELWRYLKTGVVPEGAMLKPVKAVAA